MITRVEIDAMISIARMKQEYCIQNSFVKLNGVFTFYNNQGDGCIEQRVILVRIADILGIDLAENVTIKTSTYQFSITKEEYKKKLQKYINLAV